MSILGIKNRTENWKTAYYFAPFFRNEDARLCLARRLGEPATTDKTQVKLELFWYGMRDHLKATGGMRDGDIDDLAERYRRLFPDLRVKLIGHPGLSIKDSFNYDPFPDRKNQLANNLRSTELDVVLETPTHLFIGEAKHEEGFGRDGTLVLVHQLIRQYVTARILADILGDKKQVCQFVVADARDRVFRSRQVQFLLKEGWLDENSVLTWDDIKELWP